MRGRRQVAGVLCGCMFLAATCEVAEVEIPFGDPVVVVHGVVRPDLPSSSYGCQFVVLERSFTDKEPEANSLNHSMSY